MRSKQSQQQRKISNRPSTGRQGSRNAKPSSSNRPPRRGNTTLWLRSGESTDPRQAAKALTQAEHSGVRAPGAALTTNSPPALLLPSSPGKAGTGRACCQAARPYMRPVPLRYPPPGAEQHRNRSVGPNFSNRS